MWRLCRAIFFFEWMMREAGGNPCGSRIREAQQQRHCAQVRANGVQRDRAGKAAERRKAAKQQDPGSEVAKVETGSAIRQMLKPLEAELARQLPPQIDPEAYNRLVDTEDRREGVLAFNEKRKPRFTGK